MKKPLPEPLRFEKTVIFGQNNELRRSKKFQPLFLLAWLLNAVSPVADYRASEQLTRHFLASELKFKNSDPGSNTPTGSLIFAVEMIENKNTDTLQPALM